MFGKLGNMANMAKQAMSLQKNMKVMQEQIAKAEFTGVCEGNLVEVVISGDLIIKKISISPNCIHSGESELLGELVQSAVNNAIFTAKKSAQDQMSALTQGVEIPGIT